MKKQRQRPGRCYHVDRTYHGKLEGCVCMCVCVCVCVGGGMYFEIILMNAIDDISNSCQIIKNSVTHCTFQ